MLLRSRGISFFYREVAQAWLPDAKTAVIHRAQEDIAVAFGLAGGWPSFLSALDREGADILRRLD